MSSLSRTLPLGALALLAALVVPPPAAAQDTKSAADTLVHWIRARQNPDGTYGTGLADTCRVLDVLGRSPRRYTDLDGPFVRRAAQRVAVAEAGTVPDALVVLGLAAAITGPLQAAREDALSRLLAAGPGEDPDRWLALRTFPPGGPSSWPAVRSSDAGLACLTAEDPASIAPPPPQAVADWTRWARAARLRGLTPEHLPALPSIDERATLPELVGALETVIQMHGLHRPAVVHDDDADEGPAANLPGQVEPGRTTGACLAQALGFLGKHQSEGRFGLEMEGWTGPEPGVTALCLSATAFLADRLGEPRPDWVPAGLDYLVSLQRPDGAISAQGLDVYTTSVAVEALVAGGRESDQPVIERARDFLLATQSDEGEGYDREADPLYGGVGYGGDERPDLSNTQMAIEAASRAGTPTRHAFFRKARLFLDRCQNWSEGGVLTWPRPDGGRLVTGDDGGATYMPGNSPAGEDRVGEGVYQARSYGSMTYALAKSYLFCGAGADDPRLAAAVGWMASHFSVTANPGYANSEEGAQGLFYYYLALGRTLRLLPPGGFRDAAGAPIPWREALTRQLVDTQRIDGSWINAASPRWWEGAPTLCTAYAVLALQAAAD